MVDNNISTVGVKDLVGFIRKSHFDEYLSTYVRLLVLAKIPILRFYENYSEEELVEISRGDTLAEFEAILDDTYLPYFQKSLEQFTSNTIEKFSNDSVQSVDILTIHSCRKRALISFLGRCCSDNNRLDSTRICDSLEIFFNTLNIQAIDAFVKVHNAELRSSNKLLQEHQEELQAANEEISESYEKMIELKEAFKSSAAQFQSVLDAIPQITWTYSADGKITYVNKRWIDFTGINLENSKKGQYLNAIHPEDRPKTDKVKKEGFANLSSYQIELRYINQATEEYRWHLKRTVPVYDTNNKLIMWVGTSTDIHDKKIAEQTLEREQKYLTTVFDNVEDAIVACDHKGRLSYFNKAAKELHGMGPNLENSSEWPKKYQLYSANGRKLLEEKDLPLFRAWRGERVSNVEMSVKSAEGTRKYILASGQQIVNTEGENLGAVVVMRDITETKRAHRSLEKSENMLRQAQEMANVGHWEYSFKLDSLHFSDHLFKIFGIKKQPLSLEKFISLIHDEDAEKLSTYFNDVQKTNSSFTCEYRIIRLDGTINYLLTFGKPVRGKTGEVVKIRGYSQDITERVLAEKLLASKNEELSGAYEHLKKAQSQLEVLNVELETRIASRTQELTEKNNQLSKINGDLDNFIYTASHDLKSPIANIEGLVYVLRKKLESKFEEDEEKILGLMDMAVARFNQTIRDLTEITKVHKDLNEKKELVSFDALIKNVVKDHHKVLVDCNGKVDCNIQLDHLVFSPADLRSIFSNLLSNAIKYKAPDRDPLVVISTRREDDFSVIEFKDNGLGIEESQIDKIFTMFKRLHTHVEGTGVGLYLVKRIIANNNGEIKVKSKLGEGTTFIIRFKADPAVAKKALSMN